MRERCNVAITPTVRNPMKKKVMLVGLMMCGTLFFTSCVGNTLVFLFGGFF
jgi:hypothetical protein